MACLRCGKRTDENQVFCPECLALMEQQPVKPDTPIQIPNREGPQKHPRVREKRRRADKLPRMRLLVVLLVLLAILLAGALALCVCMLLGLTPDWLNDLLLGDTAYQMIGKRP